MEIICPIHGSFWQSPYEHLQGKGCLKCTGHYKFTTEEFIERARKVHGDEYDYSKVNYINKETEVEIICQKHGSFWQKPHVHTFYKCGCPICAKDKGLAKSKLQQRVYEYLYEHNILFEDEKKFEWLRLKYPLKLDCYLPEYNVNIEIHGY